jgi:hypothetical protein
MWGGHTLARASRQYPVPTSTAAPAPALLLTCTTPPLPCRASGVAPSQHGTVSRGVASPSQLSVHRGEPRVGLERRTPDFRACFES